MPFRSDSPDFNYLKWIQDLVPAQFSVAHLTADPRGVYSYPPCQLHFCPRISQDPATRLCRIHNDERRAKKLELEQFVKINNDKKQETTKLRISSVSVRGIFDFGAVSHPTVRAELAFGMSKRANPENGFGPARPAAFNRLVAEINKTHIISLLELEPEDIGDLADQCGSYYDSAKGIINETINQIKIARGEPEARRRIGARYNGASVYTTYQNIKQSWLRELVGRWATFRYNTSGNSTLYLQAQQTAMVEFAEWCEQKSVRSPEDLTRGLLLDWLGHVNSLQNPRTGKHLSASWRLKLVSAVESFVEVLRSEFNYPIPTNARYRPGELPQREEPRPRFLEPHIIDALRKPENLALIENRAHRLAVRIMMGTGIRAGHTCNLPFDCLKDLNRNGSSDKWALAFLDTKSNSNRMLPLPPDLAQDILSFQNEQRTLLGGDAPEFLFFSPRAYKIGRLTVERLNTTIHEWVARLGLRETDGSPAVVTPHRFRHTFATENLEKGVPIEIVQELLGHRNLTSTQIYAHVSNKRLREEWEKAQLLDVRGESIAISDGPEGDAEWLLHRIARATQALPNGYCGLPIQQSCPHEHACLNDCVHFMTSRDFLPVLIQQRDNHARLISKAEANGHLRIVQINKKPMETLNRIIGKIEEEGNAESQ
ncbi:transposase [Sinomonas atrocyanea]|nr:transposase [Sinomonas atrocyanea]GGG69566.1 transposase [Sinomonas atrocyanea]